jgi:hypothetical protein
MRLLRTAKFFAEYELPLFFPKGGCGFFPRYRGKAAGGGPVHGPRFFPDAAQPVFRKSGRLRAGIRRVKTEKPSLRRLMGNGPVAAERVRRKVL